MNPISFNPILLLTDYPCLPDSSRKEQFEEKIQEIAVSMECSLEPNIEAYTPLQIAAVLGDRKECERIYAMHNEMIETD